MVNKNYRNGVEKERRIMNKARKEGKIAFRSAGSHSCVDVAIIDVKKRTIEFVQSKPKSMSDNAKKKIEEENWLLNGMFTASFRVE